METLKATCMIAAGLIAAGLTTATTAKAAPPTVIVEAPDKELQRRVSYADLNLAAHSDQKVLKARIVRTAGGLCFDLNGMWGNDECRNQAVGSTREQVARAIARANDQMAGLAVGPPIAISMVIGIR